MRSAAADYAISRARLREAKERDNKFNSNEAVAELVEQAKRSFTDLARTGEGGELLLFLLAERFLKLPHILCKMDLKTDTRMHYHGADGVYAGITTDGILKLYWGESKVYGDSAAAIRECLNSLAPFLLEPESEDAEREQDLLLLSDKADLDDPGVTQALKMYFDRSSPMSRRVKYCGVALVGFDAAIYPNETSTAVAEEVINTAKSEIQNWTSSFEGRLKHEGLMHLEIDLLCVPLPSAEGFRSAFLNAMGQ